MAPLPHGRFGRKRKAAVQDAPPAAAEPPAAAAPNPPADPVAKKRKKKKKAPAPPGDGGAGGELPPAPAPAPAAGPASPTAEALTRADLGDAFWEAHLAPAAGGGAAASGPKGEPSAALAARLAQQRQKMAQQRQKLKVREVEAPAGARVVHDLTATATDEAWSGGAIFASEASTAEDELAVLRRVAAALDGTRWFAVRLRYSAVESPEWAIIAAKCAELCPAEAPRGPAGGAAKPGLVGAGTFFVYAAPHVWCLGGWANHKDVFAAGRGCVAFAKVRRDAAEPFCVVASTAARLKELGAEDVGALRAHRLLHLFPSLSDAQRNALELDDEAHFSVSDEKSALAVCRHVRGLSKDATIVDATACVGGNVIAFAKQFERVYAVELDVERHRMLVANVKVALTPAFAKRVVTQCADATVALPVILRAAAALPQRRGGDKRLVIFVDPPWGGLGYKASAASLELKLGEMSLEAFASLCAKHGATDVLFKLPNNAKFELAECPAKAQLKQHTLSKKVQLIALQFPQ